MANRGGGSDYRSRTGTTSSTSSRYQQEYPPSDLCVTSFVASPVRRASSETRLEILHHKDIVASLERGMSMRDQGQSRDLKKQGSEVFTAETIPHSDVPASTPNAGATTSAAGAAASAENTTQQEKAYLNLEFEACFEEHPHTSVSPKIINFLNTSYKWTKLVAYYIFVILVGVPMTFVWGCLNGLAVFCCVWIWGPQLKLILLCLHSCAPAIITPVQVLCTPIVDVFARILRQVRVQAIVLGQSSLEKYSAVHNA